MCGSLNLCNSCRVEKKAGLAGCAIWSIVNICELTLAMSHLDPLICWANAVKDFSKYSPHGDARERPRIQLQMI